MSVGTLSLCYQSYSLSRTLSYCSPAFDCKIRIYLFPNLIFAALFQVEYSSYDSLVCHTRAFYLVVLIEHMVDWNIQTRLSGECPRIHGVRLSVAYSTEVYSVLLTIRINTFTKKPCLRLQYFTNMLIPILYSKFCSHSSYNL